MDRREQIRSGAVQVISEKGFHEATTDIIAKAAGVSVGTIYNYFHSKEEILGYIFEVECERRINHLRRLLEDESISAEKRLRRFLQAHLARIRSEPDVARLMVQEFRFSDRREFMSMRSFATRMPRLLGKLVQRDACCDGAPPVRGLALFGAVQGLTTQILIAPDTLGSDVDTVVEEFVEIFID